MTNPSQRALLIVDAQNDVMAASVRSPEIIARLSDMVAAARACGTPVVWVRHHDAGLQPGSDGWQIVPELVPAADERIVEKAYGDAFADTDLEQILRDLGTQEIVLAGAQSDACIRSTFYGSLYHGYDVTLVSDAHTTEDTRPFGGVYDPETGIAIMNMHAEFTSLPGRTIAVVPAAEAFA